MSGVEDGVAPEAAAVEIVAAEADEVAAEVHPTGVEVERRGARGD
jgi:hypothetical protein